MKRAAAPQGVGEDSGAMRGGSQGVGDGGDAVGAEVVDVESGRRGVCDDAGVVGAGAVGGQVWSLFKEKNI